jgi:hypothetical protein
MSNSSTSGIAALLGQGQSIQTLLDMETILKQYPQFPINFIPPSLTDPNYKPPNRGPAIAAACIVMLTLMVIIVIARLLVRGVWRRQLWGLDDWWIIPATVNTNSWLYLAFGDLSLIVPGIHGRIICHLSRRSVRCRCWQACL